MHWGPYAVPGVASEWFWYQWNRQVYGTGSHMMYREGGAVKRNGTSGTDEQKWGQLSAKL
jgi:hypothetical protein